jgi:hypothetical protein
MATTDIYHIKGGLNGRFATAFLGGNVDDYIQVDAHAVARVAANDTVGTYTAWINIPDITGTYTIVGAGDKNVVEFLELNIEAGLLTARVTDATTAQFVTQADAIGLKPHRWYHVAIVQRADGHGVDLYIDGSIIAVTNDTATDVDSWYNELDGIDSFRIGAANKAGDDSVTQEFKGGISDVKYWNVALSHTEVDQDFQNEAVQAASLQLHLDMEEDLIDSGAGADNGTAVGDIILTNNYSEFTSRLRNSTGTPVVADTLKCFADDGTGHAVVIQAA